MPAPFLRVLAQRRTSSALIAQAPTRSELEEIVRAALGRPAEQTLSPWRVVTTPRSQAPLLAAALCGLRALPDIGDGSAPLRGKQLRRLAAFRGSLSFASKGGMAMALVFSPVEDAEVPRKRQRVEAHTVRPLLEAALCASGWAVQWSPRESPDEEVLTEFYGLDEHEEILGWLFIGRPDPEELRDATAGPVPQIGTRLEYRD